MNEAINNVGYKIVFNSVRQSEDFDTFEEAFSALYNCVQSKQLIDISALESNTWIELINKDLNTTLSVKGFYDCVDFAKTLGVIDNNGSLVVTDFSDISKTINKCFLKQKQARIFIKPIKDNFIP